MAPPTAPTLDRIQPQVAALPWRREKGEVKVMIVTSRRTGRWVFPKGSVEQGKIHRSAAQEAYEETGVSGEVSKKALGRYRSLKVRGKEAWEVDVAIYPMKIEKFHKDFPEKSQRKRKLVSVKKARKLLSQPEMARMVDRLVERVEG